MANELLPGTAADASLAEELLEDAVTQAEDQLTELKRIRVRWTKWGEWWTHRLRVSEVQRQLDLAEDQLEWRDTRELGKWGYVWWRGTVTWSVLGLLGSAAMRQLSRVGDDPVGTVVVLGIAGVALAGAGTFVAWIGWHNREEGHRNWLRGLMARRRGESSGALPPN